MFNRSFYPKHIFLSRYLPKKGGDFFHDNGTPEDGRVLKYIKSILYLRTVSSEKKFVKIMHHGTSFHLLWLKKDDGTIVLKFWDDAQP